MSLKFLHLTVTQSRTTGTVVIADGGGTCLFFVRPPGPNPKQTFAVLQLQSTIQVKRISIPHTLTSWVVCQVAHVEGEGGVLSHLLLPHPLMVIRCLLDLQSFPQYTLSISLTLSFCLCVIVWLETGVLESEQIPTSCNLFHNQDLYKSCHFHTARS